MKIAVIGAGLGGLAAGTLLLQKGHKVDIFEKEGFLGGRALSLEGENLTKEKYKQILSRFDMWLPFTEPGLEEIFDKKLLHGYHIDLGFHLFGFESQSPILKILRDCNKILNVSSSRLKSIHSDTNTISGLESYLSFKDKIRLARHIFRYLLTGSIKGSSSENVPISKTIDKYYKGKVGTGLGYASMLITTVNDLDKISSKETLDVMAKWIREKRSCCYPIGGCHTLSEAFANVVNDYGGKIHLQRKVDDIVIEDGVAKGIIVDGDRIDYDTVISNIPVQGLFNIASEKEFPPSYVKTVKNLKGTGSVCVYYALKKIEPSLIGNSYSFIEKGLDIEGGMAAGIIDFQTADPKIKISPNDRYLVQGYLICSPDEARNKKKVEMFKEVLDDKLGMLIPDFEKNLVFALYPTTWHLDGVAKIINNKKPEIITPVKNFYLVGDCVKATGIGVNCAVDSAVRLANMIKKEIRYKIPE